MKYKITNIQPKTSAKTGRSYLSATLTDEQGAEYAGINFFKGELTGRSEIAGTLKQNGKFWNFEPETTYTSFIPSANKIETFKDMQTTKNDAIMHAGAITNATHLTVAESEAGLLEGKDYHDRVRENIIFYQNLYKNPESINPSASDAPF